MNKSRIDIVKRYDIKQHDNVSNWDRAEMAEYSDGDYVAYDDYVQLADETFTLVEIKGYLRSMLAKQNCMDDVREENRRLACAYNLLTDERHGIAAFRDMGYADLEAVCAKLPDEVYDRYQVYAHNGLTMVECVGGGDNQ